MVSVSFSLMNTSSRSLGGVSAHAAAGQALLGIQASFSQQAADCSSLVMPPLIRGADTTRQLQHDVESDVVMHQKGSGDEMVLEELAARLNDRGYKNWLKAGRCLLILKDGLHPFTDHHMRAFHGDLLNQYSLLRHQCRAVCKPRGNKLSSACSVCSEWQKVILKHHRQPDATVNWDNCSPQNWRTDHWEVAKAYMPRGQAKVKGAGQCDASALLNLINYCSCFSSVNPKAVREVIRFRNELMHSCDFHVTDEWIRQYHTTLKHLVNQLPQMDRVRPQIDQMLTVDLTVCVSGVDMMDSASMLEGLETDSASQWDTGAESVSQWEAELLQEMLQEFLHGAAEDEDAKTQDTKLLKSLGGFLQANKDLGERFSAELQTINSLEDRG